MRFVRFFQENDEARLGLRQGDRIFDLTAASLELSGTRVTSVTQFMGESVEPGLLTRLAAFAISEDRLAHPLNDVRLDAPIRDVPKLLALAGNFRKHVEESGFRAIQAQDVITPQVFSKPPSTTINAPGGTIALRPANNFLDWEVELAVVIGRWGRDISTADAMSYVFGYSVINDVSERQLNSDIVGRNVREFDPFFDWLLGKWFDGSAPLGPEIVTADEIANPHGLNLKLSLNGDTMQSANTIQMIFDVPQTIAYVSSVLTLEPGDVIAMGTPDGVGKARGIRLKAGDLMSAEIEGIGRLDTTVTAE
jgi:2-keto-4-pentenoate hydratase/2-oxohepta-3-ene-1,7-dioic acid hydratase in catechol pathway